MPRKDDIVTPDASGTPYAPAVTPAVLPITPSALCSFRAARAATVLCPRGRYG